jgi:hypothetical protein
MPVVTTENVPGTGSGKSEGSALAWSYFRAANAASVTALVTFRCFELLRGRLSANSVSISAAYAICTVEIRLFGQSCGENVAPARNLTSLIGSSGLKIAAGWDGI